MNAQLRAIIGMGICRGNGLSGQGETMTMRQGGADKEEER